MPLFDKNHWKKAAQRYLYSNHPEYVPRFTAKVVDATCHYMTGYGECLKENVNHPHNVEDMKAAVLEAGIKYAIKLIQSAA